MKKYEISAYFSTPNDKYITKASLNRELRGIGKVATSFAKGIGYINFDINVKDEVSEAEIRVRLSSYLKYIVIKKL